MSLPLSPFRPSDPRQYVVIVPDGAADHNRSAGGSPLQVAQIPHMHFLAQEGVTGLTQTLYPDLPRDSMVAHLGILGYDPYVYHPGGRASAELLATHGLHLKHGDIAFRANLVHMTGDILSSYSAGYIETPTALRLITAVNHALSQSFPDIQLFHNSDFRNTLLYRNANIAPHMVMSPEPHESHGLRFSLDSVITAATATAKEAVARLNAYISAATHILPHGHSIFPWSASGKLHLPCFRSMAGLSGRSVVIGFMDFLVGIAIAAGLETVRVGNGRIDTEYSAKGDALVRALSDGARFVLCHINGTDEASHAGDVDGKIRTLSNIDSFIVGPVVEYFRAHRQRLGGVLLVPDHYSNTLDAVGVSRRAAIHSLDPVPFALWNGRSRDATYALTEAEAAQGLWGQTPLNHRRLLPLLLHGDPFLNLMNHANAERSIAPEWMQDRADWEAL